MEMFLKFKYENIFSVASKDLTNSLHITLTTSSNERGSFLKKMFGIYKLFAQQERSTLGLEMSLLWHENTDVVACNCNCSGTADSVSTYYWCTEF